jgi:serine/threonine protein phosphatase 1
MRRERSDQGHKDVKRSRSISSFHAAALPARTVVYAVGDIHGRLDLLQGVIEEIEGAAKTAREGEQITAVFLGDYIDRGPSARGVIDRLIAFRASKACEIVFLRGNHEQFLLDMIDGHAEGTAWLDYGGIETLRSYGVDLPSVGGRDVKRLGEKLRDAVPPAHLGFLRETELHAERGDYVFVHAGLRPDRLLSEQSDADMLWFRYYSDDEPLHGKTVVHGHTPRPRPVAGRWRISVDTEAYDSGALTAVRLEGASAVFLKVQAVSEGKTRVTEWELVDRPHDHADSPGPVREAPARAPRPERQRRPERPPSPTRPQAERGRGGLMAAGAVAVAAVMVVGILVGLAVWFKSRIGDTIPVRPGAAAAPAPIAAAPTPLLATQGAAPASPPPNPAAAAKPLALAAKTDAPAAPMAPVLAAPNDTASPSGATATPASSPPAAPPTAAPAATADAAPVRTAAPADSPPPTATPVVAAPPGPAN